MSDVIQKCISANAVKNGSTVLQPMRGEIISLDGDETNNLTLIENRYTERFDEIDYYNALNNVEGSSASLNDIQRIYFGSSGSPILRSALVSGNYTITLDGDASDPIDYDMTLAEFVNALNTNISYIAIEDVVENVDGYTIEIKGPWTGLDAPLMISTDNSLKQGATTVNLANAQNGSDQVNISVSAELVTDAVAPVTPQNEIWTYGTTGITSGTFKIGISGGGSSSDIDITTIDAATIQNAVSTITGISTSDISVTDNRGGGNLDGTFVVEFNGTQTATNINMEPTISENATDGTPTVTVTQEGVGEVIGVHEVHRLNFSGTPNSGSMYLNTVNAIYSAASIESAIESGVGINEPCTVVADGEDFLITYDDYDSHNVASVPNINITDNTFIIEGTIQVVELTLPDAPDSGTFEIDIDSGWTSGAISYNATIAELVTIFNSICDVSGSDLPNGTVTLTRLAAANNVNFTAFNITLAKSVDIEIVNIQEGG